MSRFTRGRSAAWCQARRRGAKLGVAGRLSRRRRQRVGAPPRSPAPALTGWSRRLALSRLARSRASRSGTGATASVIAVSAVAGSTLPALVRSRSGFGRSATVGAPSFAGDRRRSLTTARYRKRPPSATCDPTLRIGEPPVCAARLTGRQGAGVPRLGEATSSSIISIGSAWAVFPSRPTIVSAANKLLTIASSVASTVAA